MPTNHFWDFVNAWLTQIPSGSHPEMVELKFTRAGETKRLVRYWITVKVKGQLFSTHFDDLNESAPDDEASELIVLSIKHRIKASRKRGNVGGY